MCQNLINILGDAHLHQMQREDTREDAILELFCTNKSSLVNSIHTIPGISDHDGIILADMSIKAVVNKKPPRKAPTMSPKPTPKPNPTLALRVSHSILHNGFLTSTNRDFERRYYP